MSRISAFPLIMPFFLLSSALFSVQGCPPDELQTLLKLKSTLNAIFYGKLMLWIGEDCCKWNGVYCDGPQDGRHVVKLDLGGIGIRSVTGEIDSSLFKLKHLEYLNLNGNYFRGEIPSQFGKLSSLRFLDLESSNLCSHCLVSNNLQWLSNMSSLEYLSLSRVLVGDKSWGSIVGSLLHLKYLDLSHCSLPPSTIPSPLLNLSSLAFLDLSSNSFSNIPSWMGELSSLTHLDLSANNISGNISNTIGNLTGQIPVSLGDNRRQYGNLSYLSLEGNNLVGAIPSSLDVLINLTFLSLGANQLKGNIPESLGNLHNLRELRLNNNHLSGSFPLSVFQLSSLIYLDVSNNYLNESIPSALMLPSSLQQFCASYNKMNGTVTGVFFQKSFKLKVLDMSNSGLSINISATWIPPFQLTTLLLQKCQIGGPIPSWISTQFSLVNLDLSATQVTGNLPSWLWDMDIEEVRLSDNQLQGSFTPTSGQLKYLDLSRNELSGHLLADIHMHLSNVEVLMLADNKFEGQILTSIANLTKLHFLDISKNFLTGNVPAALGNSTSRGLHLEDNFLEGEIPKELGSLSNLLSLRLGKNSLQGFLPLSLRNLSSLQVLDVGENNLTGKIPDWIANFSNLRVLVIRSNNFRGMLPPEIGRMPKLQVLDLSSNLFFGTIPHSYLGFPAMRSISADGRRLVILSEGIAYYEFYYLFKDRIYFSDSIDLIVKGQERRYEYVLSSLVCFDLSNNRLSGPLPHEIENLQGLMYLNLSKNGFSGQIPETLGILVQLESVDLSYNKFSGQIPWEIGNLTYLAHLNLSYNNLFGRIPQGGGQMLTFDDSSYLGNPDLWGCPLQRNCSRPGAAPPPPVGVEEKRDEDLEFLWYWMCFGLSVVVGFSGVMIVLVWKFIWRKKYFEVMDKMIWKVDRMICIPLKPKPKPMPVRDRRNFS